MARIVVLILALASIHAVLAAQSLADVARAEEARRKAAKTPAKVYTNDDLKPVADSGTPPTPPAPASTVAGKPGVASASGAKATDAKAADPKEAEARKAGGGGAPRDEKFWRDRITAARTALSRSKAFVDALQSQINGLTTEFVNMDDPARRAGVEKKRLEAIAEQDRLKKEIEDQTKAIAAIEEEARREGVPAGWLR
jgi:hypothetical protein